jgi:hypothetical protein
MWPATRSTVIQGPGCQIQCGVKSVGRASLMCSARRMAKVRSVMSCASPVVHSFWQSSTEEGSDLDCGGLVALFFGWRQAGCKDATHGTERDAVSFWRFSCGGDEGRSEAQQKHEGLGFHGDDWGSVWPALGCGCFERAGRVERRRAVVPAAKSLECQPCYRSRENLRVGARLHFCGME